MLWRRNFLIQSPYVSTAPLGTRNWKVLIRAESLGTVVQELGWLGGMCVCGFGWWGGGGGRPHSSQIRVSIYVVLFTSL